MKSKLGIFFAGFGAGITAAFLMVGLAPDRPQSQRVVSRPTVVYDDTNAAAQWKLSDAALRWERARQESP